MADPHPTPKLHALHGSYSQILVSLESVDLFVCQTCHFIETHCRHEKCSWNEEGTALTCDFCGIDGT